MTDTQIIDATIKQIGIKLLQELRAIAWFCDGSADGKMALVPSGRRHWYEPGGGMRVLVSSGCIRLLRPSYCATVRQYRPSVRVEQFGRQVLVRARALRLPIDIDDTPEEDAFEKVAQWHDKNARYCLEVSKDEPRLNEDDRRRAREAAKHHAASAAAIRNKMAGERRSAIRALKASPAETEPHHG